MIRALVAILLLSPALWGQYLPAGPVFPTGAPSTPGLVNFTGWPSTEVTALGAQSAGSSTLKCPSNSACTPVSDPSLGGNTVVVIYTYKAASGNTPNVPTVASYTGSPGAGYSASGDTWTHCGTDGNNSTNDTYIGCYYKVGAATGTSYAVVTWTAAVTQVGVAAWQGYNITSVDGYNSGSGSASTSWSTGSVTSLFNGDIYLACAVGTSTRTNVAGFAAGSGFTLDLNDRRDAGVCEEGVQSTAGALNPGITAGTSNNYVGWTLALKAGAQGTAPSGMYSAHIYHVSSATGISTNLSYSFPTVGNLFVVMLAGGGATPMTITGVSDTTNGAWANCGPIPSYSFSALASSGCFYKANATPGNLAITLTHSGTGDIGPAVFYDIVGAATTQTPAQAAPVQTSTATAYTFTTNTGYVPSASAGISFFSVSTQNNTYLGTNTGTQDCDTVGGQSLNGPSLTDQNNGCSHQSFSSNSPNDIVWQLLNNTTDTGVVTTEAVSFQAPGATIYPVAVKAGVNHATSSGTTVAVASYVPYKAGDTLAVFVDANGISTGTISVSDGTNTYTAVDGPSVLNNANYANTFYAANISASTVTITATISATNTQRSIFVVEFTGTSTSTPLDKHNLENKTAVAGVVTGTAVTTTSANEGLFFAGVCANTCDIALGSGAGPSQPWTQIATDSFGDIAGFLSSGATGNFNTSFNDTNTTGADVSAIMTFH